MLFSDDDFRTWVRLAYQHLDGVELADLILALNERRRDQEVIQEFRSREPEAAALASRGGFSALHRAAYDHRASRAQRPPIDETKNERRPKLD